MNNISIAIDGPAGSGKSTIAKIISKNFNIVYIDTGAMYRAIGYYCLCNNIDFNNENEVKNALSDINLDIKLIENNQFIYLNGVDITNKIRTQSVSSSASCVASIYDVRKRLIQIQRDLARNTSVIMDGRDIATNVLPNADVKIYISASIDERAKRRMKELIDMGENVDIEYVKKNMIKRDNSDINRKYNPLKKSPDAFEIDTTDMTVDDVVSKITEIINKVLKK